MKTVEQKNLNNASILQRRADTHAKLRNNIQLAEKAVKSCGEYSALGEFALNGLTPEFYGKRHHDIPVPKASMKSKDELDSKKMLNDILDAEEWAESENPKISAKGFDRLAQYKERNLYGKRANDIAIEDEI